MQKLATHKTNNHSQNQSAHSGMTRRELLVGIMASVGVASTVGCVDSFDKSVSDTQTKLTPQPGEISFYTPEEYQLISVLADLIIPDTDTLGALTIGVPKMMDTLHSSWASTKSKAKHNKDIAEVANALDSLLGQSYLAASPEKQLATLTLFDQQVFSSRPKGSSNYRAIKSLIARFYYLSEEGATKELRYELVPGRWEACVPFEKIGRTWAA
jgi:hypothetical protein